MNDDTNFQKALQEIEKLMGTPLSTEDREQWNKLWPEIQSRSERQIKIIKAQLEGRHAAYQNSPLVIFARKLKARQGTTMPDFEALYRPKAELDGNRCRP
jgi:hypothetical protein